MRSRCRGPNRQVNEYISQRSLVAGDTPAHLRRTRPAMTQHNPRCAGAGPRPRMPTDNHQLTASQQTEQEVKEFLEARGWQVTKLDTGARKSADFLIHASGPCR